MVIFVMEKGYQKILAKISTCQPPQKLSRKGVKRGTKFDAADLTALV